MGYLATYDYHCSLGVLFSVFILHRRFEKKSSLLWNRTSNLLFQDDGLAVVAKNFSSWQFSFLACHDCSNACEFESITASKFRAQSTQSVKSPLTIYAAYGTVTLCESSWWPVGTHLEWELTVGGRLLVGLLKTPYQQPSPYSQFSL